MNREGSRRDLLDQVDRLVVRIQNGSFETNDSSSSTEELFFLHDALTSSWNAADEEQNETKRRKLDHDLVNYRTIEKSAINLEEFSLLADTLRALLGLSLFVQENQAQQLHAEAKEELKTVRKQYTASLRILSGIFSLLCQKDVDLPTKYPRIQEWALEASAENLDIGDDDEDAQDGRSSNLISFDREALIAEENELLLMANTPVPVEPRHTEPTYFQDETLVARMDPSHIDSLTKASQETIGILMNSKGVVYPQDTPGEKWWIFLTAQSTTEYKSPLFIISKVVMKRKNSLASIASIDLQVGRDGHKWWTKTSSIIQRLKDLEISQSIVERVWGQKAIGEQLVAAQNHLL